MILPSFAVVFSALALVRRGLGSSIPANNTVSERGIIGRVESILQNFVGQAPLPSLQAILSLNNTNGNIFMNLDNIQGDILVGMKKQKELFFFYSIHDVPKYKTVMTKHIVPLITSVTELISHPTDQPLAMLNVAYSASGLVYLGVHDDLGDKYFAEGMWADADGLKDHDPDSNWVKAFKGTSIHGAFLIASDNDAHVNDMLEKILGYFGSAIKEEHRVTGAARPGKQAGHEHFGFLDGISQPAILGFSTETLPGQSLIPSGIILTGHLGDIKHRPLWMYGGSFLAFRQLQQFVPEFNQYLTDNPIEDWRLTPKEGSELLGARMMGRWKSGAPVDLAPLVDDPELGADPQRNNDFDFSHGGLGIFYDQSRCPFSAHIRKSRPRADLANLAFSNQAIRAGLPYGPEVTKREADSNTTKIERGFAFVEYQSNIGLGFRFQQVNWQNDESFPFLKLKVPGLDPINGQAGMSEKTANGLDPNDSGHSFNIPASQFVLSRGGEYLYSPPIPAIINVICAFDA